MTADPALPLAAPRSTRRGVAALAFALATGAAAVVVVGGARPILIAVAVAAFAAVAVASARQWRWGVVGVLLYMPVSGIAIIATTGHRAEHIAAVLLKDFAFVIPAYIGFAVWHARHRTFPNLRGIPLVALTGMTVIIVAQAFNPTLKRPLVGLIGLKVWLFYIPLLVLGAALIVDRRRLQQLLGALSITALVPATIGLVEAALVYSGHQHLVYRAYGPAAANVTQNFVAFRFVGGGTLRRLPSTFSFGQQDFTYLASMVAISYAWWRTATTPRGRALRGALAAYLLFAVFLCGQRGAFVIFPLLVLLLFLLDRGMTRAAGYGVVVLAVAFLATSLVLGANPVALTSHLAETTKAEFGDVVISGVRDTAGMAWRGLGTGADTGATRYAFPNIDTFTGVGGKFYESWFIKAYVELGVVGFAFVMAFLGALVAAGWRAFVEVRETALRPVAAALLAFMIWNLVYCLKTQYLDIDPVNVYFWLFVGMLLGLPKLAHVSGR